MCRHAAIHTPRPLILTAPLLPFPRQPNFIYTTTWCPDGAVSNEARFTDGSLWGMCVRSRAGQEAGQRQRGARAARGCCGLRSAVGWKALSCRCRRPAAMPPQCCCHASPPADSRRYGNTSAPSNMFGSQAAGAWAACKTGRTVDGAATVWVGACPYGSGSTRLLEGEEDAQGPALQPHKGRLPLCSQAEPAAAHSPPHCQPSQPAGSGGPTCLPACLLAPACLAGIIDEGFMIGHEDLKGNLGTNPGEIAGNGVDEDGNGYIVSALSCQVRRRQNDRAAATRGSVPPPCRCTEHCQVCPALLPAGRRPRLGLHHQHSQCLCRSERRPWHVSDYNTRVG